MDDKTVSRKRMIEEARGLDPIRGSEYERGMAELIARCFLKYDTADEAAEVIEEFWKEPLEATHSDPPGNLIAAWDNGGKTAGRYTLLMEDVDGSLYGSQYIWHLSDNCNMPNGESMIREARCRGLWFSREPFSIHEGDIVFGRRIEWSHLPEHVQSHVLGALTDWTSNRKNP